MNRLLVTGGSGLLGSSIVKRARDRFKVATTYFSRKIEFKGVTCIQIDLTDKRNYDVLDSFAPDAIVHCAALTDVDYCERNSDVARTHNVEMTRQLAALASATDAKFVYVSTDAVFDGTGRQYSEHDDPNPVNVYGETKLMGEQVVSESEAPSAIIRTNIYGWNITSGQSLAEWMLDELRTGDSLTAFSDAYFTPIYTDSLAARLLDIVTNDFTGLLHVAGTERCSKLEFAVQLADIFNLPRDLIEPISIGDIDFDAPRGRDLSLDVTRAEELFGRSLPTVRGGLENMKADRKASDY
jgi:dTDP-4-dehydrorhamnose reductase